MKTGIYHGKGTIEIKKKRPKIKINLSKLIERLKLFGWKISD